MLIAKGGESYVVMVMVYRCDKLVLGNLGIYIWPLVKSMVRHVRGGHCMSAQKGG